VSRKVAMQSIGDNHRVDIQEYIANQVRSASWADSQSVERLSPFTGANPTVDVSAPSETNSGRYWYDLHLVLDPC
jgi:hypothetical protein